MLGRLGFVKIRKGYDFGGEFAGVTNVQHLFVARAGCKKENKLEPKWTRMASKDTKMFSNKVFNQSTKRVPK